MQFLTLDEMCLNSLRIESFLLNKGSYCIFFLLLLFPISPQLLKCLKILLQLYLCTCFLFAYKNKLLHLLKYRVCAESYQTLCPVWTSCVVLAEIHRVE